MDKTDEELMIEFIRHDNREAVAMIYQRHKSKIFNFCLRTLGNRADAEDVTTGVFMVVLTGQYTFNPNAKFTTWLFTVARNRCMDHFRKAKTITSWLPFLKTEKAAFESASANTASVEEELSLEVRRAISTLPFDQREAVILREYHQMSYAEIAAVIGCSQDNVKVLIFRGREKLRQGLAPYIKEGGR